MTIQVIRIIFNIYNNTIIFSSNSSASGILLYGYPQIDSISIMNNVFYSKVYNAGHMFINQQAGGGTHLFIDHNLYYTVGNRSDRWRIQGTSYYNDFKSWQATGYDKNSKWGDPLFNNLDKGDFTVKKGSPL